MDATFNTESINGPESVFTSAPFARRRRVTSTWPGTLSLLSDACRATARAIAATSLFLIMYDNVNMMVPLHDTKLEALLTADLDKCIAKATPLTIENLELTDEEAVFFRKNMIHTILRIIIRYGVGPYYGGEDFELWKQDLEKSQPTSIDKITVHQSSIHPLPAMEIDENSTK
ncbi:hypothetical protein B0H10DRAFT_2132562 [Mycena sp. CBHHK59/15]|nr:hypothetical protein B0H10DRAFT_2132562 [Mycena sp. CBHHK59/15]